MRKKTVQKTITLKPIREKKEYAEKIQKRILELLIKELFEPLVDILGDDLVLQNSNVTPLQKAIMRGDVTFSQGRFRGSFTSSITKELKAMGASFDKENKLWRIQYTRIPPTIRTTIDSSMARLESKFHKINEKLKKIDASKITENLELQDIFSTSIWDLDKQFKSSVKNITVSPQFTEEEVKKIAARYSDNMKLSIQGFIKDEVKRLRAQVTGNALKGLRYEGLISSIETSYGVSHSKAKFLARQETNLLTHNIHQAKAESIGSESYMWQAVIGTPLHPTRKRHAELSGSIQRWDKPPIVTEPGQKVIRANPGIVWNCRCVARPIIKIPK